MNKVCFKFEVNLVCSKYFFTERDFCSSNPCKINGRCLSGQSGYRCQCYEGYTGDNCESNLRNFFDSLHF